MNILALDHFFGQDLQALERACSGQHHLRRVDYHYFRERFLQLFPEEVLSSRDFSLYGAPQFASLRERWKQECRRALFDLYRLYPFDLVILPSDIFPYVRALIPAAHELGVPVVVCQKETTISNYTMEVHARVIGEYFPFISDHMVVCSERQKQFWLNAGAPKGSIEVTGQPRFDFYGDRSQWRPLASLGIQPLAERKVITFLSYSLSAYLPTADYHAGLVSWNELHGETLSALIDAVNGGHYQLVIKPHPQQPREEVAAIEAELLRRVKVNGAASVVPGELDTRQLLVNSDLVVAFQTTALLEALLLDRRIIYTCWSEAYERCKAGLLPYEAYPGALLTVRSSAELRAALADPAAPPTSRAERLALFEEFLGPSDGAACARVLSVLRGVVDRFPLSDGAVELRRELSSERARFLLRDAAKLMAQLTVDLPTATAVALGARVLARSGTQRFALDHLRAQLSHAGELVRGLTAQPPKATRIGRRASPWLNRMRNRIKSTFA